MKVLLFVKFILPSIYNCPSWGRNLAKEVLRLEGLLCETVQGQECLMSQIPC